MSIIKHPFKVGDKVKVAGSSKKDYRERCTEIICYFGNLNVEYPDKETYTVVKTIIDTSFNNFCGIRVKHHGKVSCWLMTSYFRKSN